MDQLVRTQLAHNTWATQTIIDRCFQLPQGDFIRVFKIGPGSLQATLEHVIECMFFFGDNFAGRYKPSEPFEYEPRPEIKAKSTTPAGLTELLAQADTELSTSGARFLSTASLDAPVYWPNFEKHFAASHALAQVFDHGTHHRAQCLNMLRQLGIETTPEISPICWDGL